MNSTECPCARGTHLGIIEGPSLQMRIDENGKVFAVNDKSQDICAFHTYSHFQSIDKLQSSSKQMVLLLIEFRNVMTSLDFLFPVQVSVPTFK